MRPSLWAVLAVILIADFLIGFVHEPLLSLVALGIAVPLTLLVSRHRQRDRR